MTTKSKLKSNPRVIARIYYVLIGQNINNMKLFPTDNDDSKKKRFFFTNSSASKDYEAKAWQEVKDFAIENEDVLFGIIRMKNKKEYFFLCALDLLHITNEITQIHSIKIKYTKLKI